MSIDRIHPERRVQQGVALFCLLLLPVLFFQKWKPGFMSPGARSGDEPHYLVMATSLAQDLDLSIPNNYAPIRFADPQDAADDLARQQSAGGSAMNARQSFTEPEVALRGRYSQGIYLQGYPMSRHTNLVPAAEQPESLSHSKPPSRAIYRWDEVYEFVALPGLDELSKQGAGTGSSYADLFLAQRRSEFANYRCENCSEIAWHPLGYPFLLAIAAFPLLAFDSYWSEMWLVLLQFALYAYALMRIRGLFPLSPPSQGGGGFGRELAYMTATAMALSAYYFAACIYTEGVAPALLLLAVAAFAERRVLALSAYLGLLFFIKESYAPLGPIFAAVHWFKYRRISDLFVMAAFPLLAFALFLARNYIFYGAPLQTYYPWAWNPDPLAGATGLLFAAKKGVLVFTPVFVFFLAGLGPLYRKHAHVALVSGGVFAYFFALTSATAYWSGGPTYGYRLLTPAVAILTPAFFAWLAWIRRESEAAAHERPRLSKFARGFAFALTLFLLGVSTLNGVFGATNLDYAFDTETYVNLFEPQSSQSYRRFIAR